MELKFGRKITVRSCKGPIGLKQYYDLHRNYLQTILPLIHLAADLRAKNQKHILVTKPLWQTK